MKQLLPAYPLFVNDPYFSVWMDGEVLNENDPITWWGERKPMHGIARVNGKTYSFLGATWRFARDSGLIAAKQIDLSVDAFSTRYTFDLDGVTLRVSFVSPLLPTDLSLLSMPTCYMEYEVIGAESAEVSLFVGQEICHNVPVVKRIFPAAGPPLSGFPSSIFSPMRAILSAQIGAIGISPPSARLCWINIR